MTWPSGATNTANLDSGTDSPASARADLLDAAQKLNEIIAHVSSYIQGLLDDANAAAALSTLGAAPLASPTFTGTPTAPTPAVGHNDTGIATTAFVQGELASRSTPAFGDSDGSIATTEFVNASRIVKRKTADESVTSSTALQDDNHLAFAIGANEEWVADYDLYAENGLSVTGIKLAVTVPAGATMFLFAMCSALIPAGNSNSQSTSSSGAALNYTTAMMTNASPAYFRMSIRVVNGANAGSVTLQFAQSTSSATAVALMAGSSMKAQRVA